MDKKAVDSAGAIDALEAVSKKIDKRWAQLRHNNWSAVILEQTLLDHINSIVSQMNQNLQKAVGGRMTSDGKNWLDDPRLFEQYRTSDGKNWLDDPRLFEQYRTSDGKNRLDDPRLFEQYSKAMRQLTMVRATIQDKTRNECENELVNRSKKTRGLFGIIGFAGVVIGFALGSFVHAFVKK